MEQPTTIPFHIAISARQSNHNYLVSATYQSHISTAELVLPTELQSLLPPLTGAAMPARNPKALGKMLSEALFVPTLRDMFLRSVKNARRLGARLQVQLYLEGFDLIGLPWEWLTLPNTSAQQQGPSTDITLVRINYLSAPQEPPAPLRLNGPLRILAIASKIEELQLISLHRELEEALSNQQIVLQLLHKATLSSLARALADFSPHVLHCAASVRFDLNGTPTLQLGGGISASELREVCGESPDLRVVTLTGAQGNTHPISTSLPSFAITLVHSELPAVISLGARISAHSAALCAAICYEQLTQGAPIDLAVTAARTALAKQNPNRDWGYVQLHLLPGAEQVFLRGNPRTRQISQSRSLRQRVQSRIDDLQPTYHHRITHIPVIVGIPALVILIAFFALLWNKPNSATFTTASIPITTPHRQQPTTTPIPMPIPPPQSYATYIVGLNDTLDSIAARLGSNSTAIAALNRLDPTTALRVGRVLMVPQYQPQGRSAGGQLIERGNPYRPTVALTFDVESDSDSVRRILLSLKERNLKATFFVTGSWVKAFPELAQEIVQQGHEIANHTHEHPDLTQIGLEDVAKELEVAERRIQSVTGVSARPYFRFPYGAWDSSLLTLVAEHGYIAYHWTADDAAIPAWLERVEEDRSAANGSILLMHGRPDTADALPAWLDRIIELGLIPTTLGETLR